MFSSNDFWVNYHHQDMFLTGFELHPFVLTAWFLCYGNLSEVLTEFESVLGQILPLIEGKFDQVFPVTVNLFSETLMLFVKVAVSVGDGSWMTWFKKQIWNENIERTKWIWNKVCKNKNTEEYCHHYFVLLAMLWPRLFKRETTINILFLCVSS